MERFPKNRLVIFSILFISGLFFSQTVNAGTLSCTVATTCPSGTVIWMMSGTTNAHAELPSQSLYTQLVCCSGVTGLGNSCSGTYATALKLSGTTNAHAEQNSQANYANNACISVPSGGSVSVGYQATNCAGFDTTLGSMTGTTNAHVGDGTAYTTKICATATAAANTLPVASGVSINSGAASITLTENTTTPVSCTATVTDNDGCTDITGANYIFYRTSQGSAGATDNNYRYSGSCTQDGGSCTGGGDLTATYTCTINAQFYTDPTDAGSPYPTDDWTCRVTPSDNVGAGTADTDTIEMNSLTALNVTANINYGTLGMGTDTGATNQTAVVTNTGNRSIDSQMSGTDMSCTIGSIPVGNQEYSASAFTYGAGTDLSGTPTSLVLTLPQPTNDVAPVITDDSLWGLGMPTMGVSGSCTGTNTFTAIND